MISTISTTVYVLFSLLTGHPVPEPNTFGSQSACSSAAATYARLSRTHERFRCQPFQDVNRGLDQQRPNQR